MKYILTSVFIFIAFVSSAQVPQGMSYQAVAFNTNGQLATNTTVGVQISILDNSATGPVIYVEQHNQTTNAQGLYSLNIGQGTATTGIFSNINWGVNLKFLKVEIDVNGGTNYTIVGTNQFMSVPYALAAESLVTSPGEGITLLAPDGTPYQLTVDNNGELSLPTSNNPANAPTQLFLYGSFNNWDPNTALQFGNRLGLQGFKYFTAGTELKFLTQRNENVVFGGDGNNVFGELTNGGSPVTIEADGFYNISVYDNFGEIVYELESIDMKIAFLSNFSREGMSYDVASDEFFLNSTRQGQFYFDVGDSISSSGYRYGDNLADGILEYQGANINIPTTGGPNQNREYRLRFNFNATGSYTIN